MATRDEASIRQIIDILVTIILNHQKHFNIIMFHFISQRFAPSVEPLVFGYGSKETLHIQSSTWPRGVCQLGHGHRGCLLQMCSRLHHSPQVQQWSQSQRGNWLLKVTTYLLTFPTHHFRVGGPSALWKTHHKVKILWKGHKNLKNLPLGFDITK